MKNVIVILIVGCFFTSKASAVTQDEDIERLSAALCGFIQSDDRSSIRKKLKSANLNLRNVYTGFVCQPFDGFSGGSLIRAASFFGSEDVSGFLIAKISKTDANFTEFDGIGVIEWTEKALKTGQVKDSEKTKRILSQIQERTQS